MEITQVIGQLKGQLAETEADAQRLRTAIAALEGSVASSDAPAPTRRSPRARATRQRSSNGRAAGKAALTPDVVVKLVTPEGVPAREIRSQVSGSDNQVLKVLKDLESDGKITRTGQRRATKWHLVTSNGASATRAAKPTRKARQPKSEPTAA
jgi:hypothetical protein